MNLLTFKSIAWDERRKGFYSPSHPEYLWDNGIAIRDCVRGCQGRQYDADCRCGIYTSPNWDALDEYAKYPNSIHVLMEIYGWLEIWPGPERDLPDAFILRSWGTKIKAIINTTPEGEVVLPQRWNTALLMAERMKKPIFPWHMTKTLVEINWKSIFDISPYKPLTHVEKLLFEARLEAWNDGN